jgi:hypothetical protein
LEPVSWSPGSQRKIESQALGRNRIGPALATGPAMGEDRASVEGLGPGALAALGTITTENIMAGLVDKRLSELGIVLPVPASPIANYVGFVRTGALLIVSGQLCFDTGGKLLAKGKLGQNVSIEDGQKAARAPSTCSPRSRPRSAIWTRWRAWCGSAASSIQIRPLWTAPR